MSLLKQFIIILLLVSTKGVLSKNSFEKEIERLESWYNKRIEEVAEYEFPTDARMYEADDKVIRGISLFNG